jgi:hypothetical protein
VVAEVHGPAIEIMVVPLAMSGSSNEKKKKETGLSRSREIH